MTAPNTLIRIGGEGGEGIISTGDLLSRAASRAGMEIMTYRTFPAEIKGGLAQFQMKLSTERLLSIGGEFHHLMAFNQEALDNFHASVGRGGNIFYDPAEGSTEGLNGAAEKVKVPLSDLAKDRGGSLRGKNMVALGFLTHLVGIDLGIARGLVEEKFHRKGDKVLQSNFASLDAGFEFAAENLNGHAKVDLAPSAAARQDSIVISGNEATMLGAIAGGCRFMAGYPITPASSILEFASRHLGRFGGSVVQCEDEIAALAACIGASFGGVKSMTATSGPGLMLMTELITLAATNELPVVIIDVQRAGPSTGMPTKQEQSDLRFAIYGTAGEAPKIVVAPTSVEDCFYLTARAFNLAEKYQTPVLVLSDTSLAVRTETITPPSMTNIEVVDRLAPTDEEMKDYRRYRDTPTGVSPIVSPGTPGGLHVAASLEHDEYGSPCYTGTNHDRMNAKRFRKLETLKADFDEWVADFHCVEGAEIGIIGWGSTAGAIREAVAMAAAQGVKVSHFHPRIVAPLPEKRIAKFLTPLKTILVVEENFTGQFSHFLKAKFGIRPIEVLKAQGVPFNPEEIHEAIMKAV